MAHYVTVLVLGDLGRSPRMCYHSLSLASSPNTRVQLIGYDGSEVMKSVEEHPNIKKVFLSTFTWFPKRFFLLFALFKILFQIIQLFWTLMVVTKRPKVILVQNPPSIPTLFVARVACFLLCSKLIIDWHNFGYSILSHSKGANHWSVPIALYYEKLFGSGVQGICVTAAMRSYLGSWGIEAAVLHDRPSEIFRSITIEESHFLFKRVEKTRDIENLHERWYLEDLSPDSKLEEAYVENRSLFTIRNSLTGKISLRQDRPMLFVSSTSWTDDEDFVLLFHALVALSQRSAQKIVVIITGKGPNKASFEELVSKTITPYLSIHTLWLSAEDYTMLLASADLGISMHTSSSGLDLPMKVVDMFGSGLPVVAKRFACVDELVQDNINGFLFDTQEELVGVLQTLVNDFPKNNRLSKMKQALKTFQSYKWQESWTEHVSYLFE